jgi:hypothetical protein
MFLGYRDKNMVATVRAVRVWWPLHAECADLLSFGWPPWPQIFELSASLQEAWFEKRTERASTQDHSSSGPQPMPTAHEKTNTRSEVFVFSTGFRIAAGLDALCSTSGKNPVDRELWMTWKKQD